MSEQQSNSTSAPSRARPRRHDEVDTEVRRILKDSKTPATEKYMELVVGRKGLWPLLKYELLTGSLGFVPGALGLALRQKLYRGLFARCGRGVVIGRNVTIRHPHRIALGNNVVIDDNALLDAKGDQDVTLSIGESTIIGRNTIISCKGGTIDLGDHVNISVNCTLVSESQLRIGDKTMLAGHCYVIAGGNHGTDRVDIPVSEQYPIDMGGIDIERHSWLGAHVTILDGVAIGRDAIVAAGAVVTQPVDAFDVVAGVPAKVVKNRWESARQ